MNWMVKLAEEIADAQCGEHNDIKGLVAIIEKHYPARDLVPKLQFGDHVRWIQGERVEVVAKHLGDLEGWERHFKDKRILSVERDDKIIYHQEPR